MTELLEKAIEATRALEPALQDDAARLLLLHAGFDLDDDQVVELTLEEEAALRIGIEQAERGAFATDEQMRAIMAKYVG